MESLRKITARHGSLKLEEKLLAGDVPCAKLRMAGEAIEKLHVQDRQILEEMDYPGMGRITTVKIPIFFSGQTPANPLLGKHSREIPEDPGYSPSEIAELPIRWAKHQRFFPPRSEGEKSLSARR